MGATIWVSGGCRSRGKVGSRPLPISAQKERQRVARYRCSRAIPCRRYRTDIHVLLGFMLATALITQARAPNRAIRFCQK